ncbi:MAG: sulfotransferase family protein [Chitinophagales bacterium]
MASISDIDLMIIGAQKAGTTSLKNYLSQHPQIITHLQAEFSYFMQSDRQSPEQFFRNYFPTISQENSKKIIAKCAGMSNDESALMQLKQANPECILILLLRNPVDRAYSSYLMEVNSGLFERPWEDVRDSLRKYQRGERDQMFRLFIELGLYADQLEKIYRHFPKQHVLLFRFEEMNNRPQELFKKIFNSLRIDERFIPDVSQRYNPTKRPRVKVLSRTITWLRITNNPAKRLLKRLLPSTTFARLGDWVINSVSTPHRPDSMDAKLRSELIEFFRPFNEKLHRVTGLNFEDWNQ